MQIIENTVESSKDPIMIETFFSGGDEEPKENDRVICTTILYRLPLVKSILSQTKTIYLPYTLNEVSEIIQ